jgi:hypothetical protein
VSPGAPTAPVFEGHLALDCFVIEGGQLAVGDLVVLG